MSAFERSRFEIIFEKISFTIDLITEKYQRTNFVQIDKLVEKIKNTDESHIGLPNVQEILQEYKVRPSQMNDKILYYLAAKVNLIYPNGLADIYHANPKNNILIDQINYNLLAKTPKDFKKYFYSNSSLFPKTHSINSNTNNNTTRILDQINQMNFGSNLSNASNKSFENQTKETLYNTCIQSLLNPAKRVDLKEIAAQRVLMQDIDIAEDEIIKKIREIIQPGKKKWEEIFEFEMKKFFEYIDEDSKIFYNYVISFHTLQMRKELIKYYQDNIKQFNEFNISSGEKKTFSNMFEILEFKFRLLIISRIYNFMSGVDIVFDFIGNDQQVNLRFYTNELTYVKIAEFFEYSLQLKPYALKYSMLKEKCKLKKEEINSIFEELSVNNHFSNDEDESIKVNKEEIGEAEKEKLITPQNNSNSRSKETEKSKQLNAILNEKLRLSTMNVDAKLTIFQSKITEMNHEYRKLQTEELDQDNHLNFPPYECCLITKYDKFRTYNEKDEFIENDSNDDFVNTHQHQYQQKILTEKKNKISFFKKETVEALKTNFLKNVIFTNKTNEEKTEEQKELIEFMHYYLADIDSGIPKIQEGLSIFLSVDKLRLLTLSFDRIFRLEKLKKDEFLSLSFYQRNPHSQHYSNSRRKFLYDSLSIFSKKTQAKFLNHIRNYLGEEISFYLLWLQELIYSLIIPSFLGLFAYIALMIKITNEKGERVYMTEKSLFNFFHLQIRINDLIEIFLCLMMAVWCLVFLQHWKSVEKFYSYLWNCSNSQEMEPQQESYNSLKEINFIFDWKIKIQDKTMYTIKKLISYSISGILVFIVVLINILVLILKKEKLAQAEHSKFWAYFPTTMNAVLIKLMSFSYRVIASKLSYWENHPKNSERVANLSLKIFLFEFVNNFFTYYYIGFYKSAKNECADNNCSSEIEIQSYLSLSIIASINFLEIGIPYLIYNLKLRSLVKKNQEAFPNNQISCNENDTVNNANKTEIAQLINSDEMKIELSSMDSLIEDYIEIIIYLAYVLLITSAAPLTPLFILILLMSEKSIDAFKIYYFFRLEFLNSTSGISIYNYMIRIILYVGTITNLGLVLFSRKYLNIDSVSIESTTMTFTDILLKFLILLILQNLFFLLGSIIRFKDYPDWMENTKLIERSYQLMYWNVNKQNLPHLNNIKIISDEDCSNKQDIQYKNELLRKIELFHNNPEKLLNKSEKDNQEKKLSDSENINLNNVDYEMRDGI